MSVDLIVSDQGKVMIASAALFPGEVSRVDFDAETCLLTLNYRADDLPAQVLDMPVNAQLAPMLRQAPRVLLVALQDGAPLNGFDVPLTCIER